MSSYILDDVRAYLVAQGAVPSGWACYEGYIPDDQDHVIALFETGGYPADTLNRENERVTFQVRVRAGRLQYQACKQTWLNIFNAIQDSNIGDAASYYLVQALHYGPAMFSDDRGRTNMTMNFRVIRKRSV